MSAANSLIAAQPGDLIIYAGAYSDGVRIGRFVSAASMMFRLEPYTRDWRTSQWEWGRPVSMAKHNAQRRIPREVWKGDDAFVYKLHEALKLDMEAYASARRLLHEEYRRNRDTLLDSVGAVPK